MQFGQRVRSATISTSPMDIGAVVHEQLNHWNVPSLRRDVQRRVVKLAPGKVRVGAVLEQPTHAGVAPSRVVGPTQDIAQRGNSARDAVDVDAKAMQQFKGSEIAATRSDVH